MQCCDQVAGLPIRSAPAEELRLHRAFPLRLSAYGIALTVHQVASKPGELYGLYEMGSGASPLLCPCYAMSTWSGYSQIHCQLGSYPQKRCTCGARHLQRHNYLVVRSWLLSRPDRCLLLRQDTCLHPSSGGRATPRETAGKGVWWQVFAVSTADISISIHHSASEVLGCSQYLKLCCHVRWCSRAIWQQLM